MKTVFWRHLFLFSTLAAPAAQHAQDLVNPLTTAVAARYHVVRQNIVESAEAMPDAAYDFRPTPHQRTFAEWLTHTAMSNYVTCAAMMGTAPPDTSRLAHLKTRPEVEEALRRSFEPCDTALNNMNDAKALAPMHQGGGTSYPVQFMVTLVASLNEHYGNLVCYLRAKGITPPSTARRLGPPHTP